MPLLHPTDLPAQSPSPLLNPQTVIDCLGPQLSQRRRRRIDRVVRQRLCSVTVVLERLYDPHNGAAVLRSCEAVGLLHVHVIPFEPDDGFSFSRAVTQNADKWLGVYLHADVGGAVDYLHRAGFACWAAVPPPPLAAGEQTGTEAIAVDRPVALVFGNEHGGLSRAALEACDGCFSLPMHGFSESYNLSVSVALSLQAVTGRRRAAIRRQGDLPAAAQLQLRAAYYARSVRHAPALLLRHLRGLAKGSSVTADC